MCQEFCLGGVFQHALGQTPRCPVHAGIHTPCPVHADIHTPLGRHPPQRPLQETVRILLECILVYGVDTTYPDEENDCQIVRSGPNFNEVQNVVQKQSYKMDCNS